MLKSRRIRAQRIRAFQCALCLLAVAGTSCVEQPSELTLTAVVDSNPAPTTAAIESTDVTAVAGAADVGWPCLFGPRGDCRSPDMIDLSEWSANGPLEQWRMTLGRGYSAPVLTGDRVALFHRVDDQEVLSLCDVVTARPIWRQADPTSFRCKYEYSDGPYATPRIDGEFIYTVGADGRLNCRTMSAGRLVWHHDLTAEFQLKPGPFGYGPQIYVDDRQLVLNVGGPAAGIVAFDKSSGVVRWIATEHPAAYTMPRRVRVADREYLVVLTDVGLVSLDPETGLVCDEFPFRSKVQDSIAAVSPAVEGSRVLVVGGRGAGAASLEVQPDGRFVPRWRQRRALDSLFNTLVVADRHVFGFTSTQMGVAGLRCLDPDTGRVCWSYPSELERGQAIAIGDKLLVLGEHGHLAVLAVDSRKPAVEFMSAEPVLKAPCYAAPAYHDGWLVARNETTAISWKLRRR